MKDEFYKFYDQHAEVGKVVKIAKSHYTLLFGNGIDESSGNAYVWRMDYDHLPTKLEAKSDVDKLINGLTDGKILSGLRWHDTPVWLSTENQFNFKCAYDIAVQTGGASLPATYKLGEDGQGLPIYHTFETLDDFTDFYMSCVGWIQQCISDGWAEKDGVDYDAMLDGMND